MSSGIHRFLTRREKFHKRKDLSSWGSKNASTVSATESAIIQTWKLFSIEQKEADSSGQQNKATKQLVSRLEQRISAYGIPNLGKPQIRYALQSKYADGDAEKAFELMLVIQDSIEGILRTYRPSTKLLGAENRLGVTCYLDALLFAMFARLDFFEGVLYKPFDDEPRRNLVILLRLWVNLLRSGKLITTDITKELQDALAACGWADAALSKQQDASEAFTFITEKLELPLITLKMDIFHTGKEETGDDHKFVNERLLEVAIPPSNDGKPVTLEECLEAYFNNRVEIKRFLERQNTLNSMTSVDSLSKGHSSHIETVDFDVSPISSPLFSASRLTPFPELPADPSSVSESPVTPLTPVSPTRSLRPHRTSSIVRERFFPDTDNSHISNEGSSGRPMNRPRKGSVRKEVMMPAWQIFSLIPWYTDSIPTNHAETAAHFSTRRPILGMCLKRYSVLPEGRAIRLDTYVDIPTEIGLPHFIKDDNLEDDAPLYGNFKLSLQAMVCHRGNSVDSGHYIAFVRGTSLADLDSSLSSYSLKDDIFLDHENYWLRFDDIAQERITLIDIEKALKDESPYLLFYQIVPIEADPADLTPPPYEESDRYGDVLFEKGLYAASQSTSENDLQEPALRWNLSTDTTGVNCTSEYSEERPNDPRKKSRSRSRPASSEKKLSTALSSYLSRKKSAEPLSAAQSMERVNSGDQRCSEDICRGIEKAVRSPALKKTTRPDRECMVM
ncbi:hypothetical protein PRK78_002039 [Emydomyces testavorans]|uniref:ubiquitinyl hydrolase 1 n=1 Tax=Emydomyces testavorans TaxID=2070801 RepID=A0AAF0IH90_9EURO|nr:hypothetical protein PRK78_002039 [Emydomyces testavorans]